MLLLKCCLDPEQSILPCITKERDPSFKHDKPDIKVRIVGQESNNEVLCCWDDFLPFSSQKKEVTYVGAYHPAHGTFVKLFTFETTVNIVSCSLSPDRFVLAYVILTNDGKLNSTYQAFLVEIHPGRSCIFDLNLAHTSLLHVQFLWPLLDRGAHDNNSSSPLKESRLLVFLHNQSIGLYQIKLERAGKGMMLSGPPTPEQVCGTFLWAQFEKSIQRLYFVVPKSRKNNTEKVPIFRCIEFLSRTGKPNPTIELELPFPIKISKLLLSSMYDHTTLRSTISDKNMNMRVIAQPHGALTLCYQHPYSTKHLTQRSIKTSSLTKDSSTSVFTTDESYESLPHSAPGTPSGDTNYNTSFTYGRSISYPHEDKPIILPHIDVQYSILCVHNGTCIKATVHEVPHQKAKNLQLFFGPLDGGILVYYPGVVCHLLNVSPKLQPCHHLSLGLSTKEDDGDVSLGYISWELGPRQSGNCILVGNSGKAYQYFLNREEIKAARRKELCPMVKSLLHVILLHNRDSFLAKEIIQNLMQEATALDLSSIFAEYLVCSTYATFKKEVNDFLQFLPFTKDKLFEEHVIQNSGGKRIATFQPKQYKYIKTISINLNERRERRLSTFQRENFWQFLSDHVKGCLEMEWGETLRYEISSLRQQLEDSIDGKTIANREESPKSPKSPLSDSLTFQASDSPLKRGMDSVRKKFIWRKKKDEPEKPAHTEASRRVEDESTRRAEYAKDLIISHIHKHLRNNVTYASSEKLLKVATSYYECQLKQVQSLLDIMLKAMHIHVTTDDDLPWNVPLNQEASAAEENLFHLMERMVIAVEEECFPFPPDFHLNLICLGFRCLDKLTFLDYVQHGVFHLNLAFMKRVIRELPDKIEENKERKLQLINLLPKGDLAVEVLRAWNHPLGNSIITRWHMESPVTVDLLLRDTPRSLSTMQADNVSILSQFPPLDSLLRDMQCRGAGLQYLTNPTDDKENMSQKFLECALYHTLSSCAGKLDGINF